MACAWRAGFTVIRLLQEEVFADKIDLATRLLPLLRDGGTCAQLICLYGDQSTVKYNPLMKFYAEWCANKDLTVELESDESSDDETTFDEAPELPP